MTAGLVRSKGSRSKQPARDRRGYGRSVWGTRPRAIHATLEKVRAHEPYTLAGQMSRLAATMHTGVGDGEGWQFMCGDQRLRLRTPRCRPGATQDRDPIFSGAAWEIYNIHPPPFLMRVVSGTYTRHKVAYLFRLELLLVRSPNTHVGACSFAALIQRRVILD